MNEVKTIHHQRRWFYLLWSGLLAAAIVALAMWVIPGHRGEGKLGIRVRVKGAPEGMVTQAWSGPASAWKPSNPSFGAEAKPGKEDWYDLPTLTIPIVRRRWWKLLHPLTADQVVLRFMAPGGDKKFVFIDLKGDLYHDFLRENRTLGYSFQLDWATITGADGSPTRIF